MKDLGEFKLIDLIALRQPEAHGRLLRGIGDDCAVISGEGELASLVTVDTMVEGSHFDVRTSKPEGIGAKLLAVNLSDVAAMGGTPCEVFLAISAAPDFDADFIERVINGLQSYGLRFGVQLAGGDTTSTAGPLVLTLTLIGTCPGNQVVYRSGAKPGDSVFVTGTPGDSGAGLLISQGSSPGLSGRDRKYLLRRHHRPEPRVDVGRKLASDNVATAMIDVSDGLGADLRHICQQSQVDVVIDPALLPVSDALTAFCEASKVDPVDMVLSSGEDYELTFTARSGDFCADWDAECRLTYIGRVVSGSGLTRIGSDEENQVYDKEGFDHFSGSRKTQ